METETVPSANKEYIISLLEEAYSNRTNDLERSRSVAEYALKLSRDEGDFQLTGKALSHLSLFHMIQGNYENCIELGEEAISYFNMAGDEKGVADAKYSIAGAFYKTDDFSRGLSYLTDCIPIFQKYEDHHNEARTWKSIGTIYEYFGDEKAAITAYQSSIEAGLVIGDLDVQSNAYNPLSGIYLNQGRVEDAKDLIEKSIAMKTQTADTRGLAFALYGRGKVYVKLGEFEKAEKDYFESIKIHQEMGEKLGVAMTFHKLGALYQTQGNLIKAKEFLKKGLDFADTNNIALIKFKCSYLLHEIYKSEGNLEKSLEYLQNFVREREFVVNTRSNKIIEGYDAIAKMEAAEAEILIQKEKATIIEQKNIELDSFFHRVSHDLKGPVNSLLSLDMIIREEITDEAALPYLDMYQSQIFRINQMLEGLIKLARVTNSNEDADKVDFQKLISECIESFHLLPNYDKIAFQVKVSKGIRYHAEWALVNTIVQNLIENAIKYVRLKNNKPEINVSVQESTGLIEIVVEDNGLGIAPSRQQSIFDIFYQEHNRNSGVGLGLFIIKRAIDQLSGSIALESAPDEGSRFIVSLPSKRG